MAAKNERPVIDARAKQCCCRKSTYQAGRFLPCCHATVLLW
nr:MAG TPA: hypothetical protein [Bacteriophage sp.]